jgi:hypothetical protein
MSAMFKERQEKILFAFEMGIDRALTPVSHGGDFIQLGVFVSISHENPFRGVEKTGLRFPDAKLLFTQRFHGTPSSLSIQVHFLVDNKLTSQYVL